jgi:hypothetical protein
MIVKSRANDDRRGVRTDDRERFRRSYGIEALAKSDIAQLTVTAINNMTCDELARLIRGADLPALLRTDLDEHLQFYDRTVLARLAHLAQRCCRNQEPGLLEPDVE